MTKIAITPHRLSPLSGEPGALERAGLLGGDASPEEVVVAYHERTKHHFHRYAAAQGYMDWATQPDPFRRYAGADLVRLPLPKAGRPLPYWQLYASATLPPAALSFESVSLFFRYALSLTAWKQVGETRWPLRANPSSGNLHPTEGYALLPALEGLGDTPAVYHYAPREHALERRATLDAKRWTELVASFPEGSFLVGLSSVHWREAWKYGERAFRYCQHDVGHALASLRIAAAALGWRLVLQGGVSDGTIASLLGLDRDEDFTEAEREEAELLVLITPDFSMPLATDLKPLTAQSSGLLWQGRANTLSPVHSVEWPVIDEVAQATRRCESAPITEDFSGFPSEEELFGTPVRQGLLTVEQAILGRRSAVAMDGSTAISQEAFFRMLARLIPTRDGRAMPWDAIPWRPRIHLGLFVHRVDGLAPGLYALARDPGKVEILKAVMGSEFCWQRVPDCPPGLPLYLLKEGDCRALASTVSCGQAIAGDGAFSLAMIADYRDSLATYGAAFYRNLFWEAGMVGQLLYLEAEEAGIRATGIGCYFDDPVHAAFGIASREWQSFYHFTVGAPVEDGRLSTLPAYNVEEER
ncbi:MAG: SagB/ThcOx family dehydrogenase [Rhodoferax sp.]|uniref:SagB/ThcOx family dehydrogenase n=1 Tax=Rhodoferax sp. TaxID=50421 RepID=UPI00185B64B3|nr:SagB/ThcOx family dehydrogenase [Rhodoferax sp.]NMM13261.1 SagB/ThcOx family dehydrogenase [Rhodoferax sp.]NMM20855.1 SagB/ThcOx family dehydrogenase [Rhodoferax sp.]